MKDNIVYVDSRETEHRKKMAQQHFPNIIVKQLDTGDYVYKDVAIEFKTVKDFIGSVKDHRVFNQAVKMNEQYRKHYVIIYGDVGASLRELYRLRHRFTIQQYLGAVASLSQVTQVLKVDNETQAFKLAKNLFQKSTDGKDRTRMKIHTHRKKGRVVTVLSCIGGINDSRAETLVNELGLKTLDDLLRLDKKDIMSVKGFGEKTAQNIIEYLK